MVLIVLSMQRRRWWILQCARNGSHRAAHTKKTSCHSRRSSSAEALLSLTHRCLCTPPFTQQPFQPHFEISESNATILKIAILVQVGCGSALGGRGYHMSWSACSPSPTAQLRMLVESACSAYWQSVRGRGHRIPPAAILLFVVSVPDDVYRIMRQTSPQWTRR